MFSFFKLTNFILQNHTNLDLEPVQYLTLSIIGKSFSSSLSKMVVIELNTKIEAKCNAKVFNEKGFTSET